MKEKKVNKAVIPVAGLGTRMLPATKAIPKELLPVFDRPIIEHVVKEALYAGITEIILVTRSGKGAIENHFDANYELEHRLETKGSTTILGQVKNILPAKIKITSIRQPDALGLGHAVLCAKHLINNEPFAVLLPDIIILDTRNRKRHFSFKKMVDEWNISAVGQVMVGRVSDDSIENYGIVDLNREKSTPFASNKIFGLVEKPQLEDAPSNLGVLGRYILPFEIMSLLEKVNKGFGGEIQLTDALDMLLKTDFLNAFETDAEVHDCGNKVGFLIANLAIGLRDKATEKMIKTYLKSYQLL